MKRKMVYVIRRRYPNDSGEREYLSNSGKWVKSRENLMTFPTRELARAKTKTIGAGVPWGMFVEDTGGVELLTRVTINKLGDLIVRETIFNPPYTIINWQDGVKTISKCKEDEVYNEYIGFTACVAKRVFGGHNQYKHLIESANRVKEKIGKENENVG